MQLTTHVRRTRSTPALTRNLQEGDNPAAMLQPVGAMAAAAHRLVIEPRVDESASHDCQLCPANLCKVPFLCSCLAGSSVMTADR